MTINHVLVVVDPYTDEVVHMSGYEEYPNEFCRNDLLRELAEDEMFECTEYEGLIVKDGDADDLAICRGLANGR